ncbi:MAG: hypothetical protein KJ064_08530 [Anaerolineae bacterium]|nr:hypothetical protein [Anaerolineae bacterium]
MRSKMWIILGLTVLLVLGASNVLAHEHRHVGGYEVSFGWRVEPAYAGIYNGPEVFVEDEDGNPVEGLEEILKLEVSFGSVSKALSLYAVWQSPGHYTADLLPTLPGDYSFRLFGMIHDVEVDEVFTSADGQYSSVEPLEDIAFPNEMSLQARIEALEAQIADLMAQIED